jgi:hypothetical protein
MTILGVQPLRKVMRRPIARMLQMERLGRPRQPRDFHVAARVHSRRVVWLPVVIALAVGAFAVPVPMMAAQLPDPCDQGSQTNSNGNPTWIRYAYNNATGSSNYDAALGESVARNLDPCEYAILFGGNGASMVWAANLQNNTDGLVQIGYVETAGTNYNGIPAGARRFAASVNDRGVDFTILSVSSLGDTPVTGHQYRFSVARASTYWHFCIIDRDGDDVAHCVDKTATWAGATTAWWAFETDNSNDAMGTLAGSTSSRVFTIQYRTANDQVYHLDTGGCDGFDGSHPYYVCYEDAGHSIRAYSN